MTTDTQEGFVLVPREPTEEMIAAMVKDLRLPWREIGKITKAWRIMVSAAPGSASPSPPAAEGGDLVERLATPGSIDFANWSYNTLPERTGNVGWQPDLQDLIYTAINHVEGDYEDADENCAEQVIERLVLAIKELLGDRDEAATLIRSLVAEREEARAEALQSVELAAMYRRDRERAEGALREVNRIAIEQERLSSINTRWLRIQRIVAAALNTSSRPNPSVEDAAPWPAAPWPAGATNNARIVGWNAYFQGKAREGCPFPPIRRDLHAQYVEGWDAALSHSESGEA